MMAAVQRDELRLSDFLGKAADGRTVCRFRRGQIIFAQGDSCDGMYFVTEGRMKLTVLSNQGKEAVIGILGPHSLLGEECLGGAVDRAFTATAITAVAAVRFSRRTIELLIEDDKRFARLFTSYLLTRKARVEADLMDQLFHSSEKRLARKLLVLAGFPENGASSAELPKISQETLAEMVGTTRSRVSYFMNRFRKAGYVEYGESIHVRSSLVSVVMRD